MSFSLSPGVNVTEIDLTTVIPAVSTTDGALVAELRWGPCEEIVLVSSEDELVASFGKPDSSNAAQWFSAANFLAYGNKLRLVRSIGTNAANAHLVVTPVDDVVLVKNDADFEAQTGTLPQHFIAIARYPGVLGNGLIVSLCGTAANFATWTYKDAVGVAPGTSAYAANLGGANDEVHVVIVDGAGKFSGVKGEILEKYTFASKIVNSRKDDGSSACWIDLVNRNSKYVRILSTVGPDWKTTDGSTVFAAAANYEEVFGNNGSNGTVDDGDVERAYDLFKNAEKVDVALVITANHSLAVSAYIVQNICEVRKDCIALISPLQDSVINNQDALTDVLADRETLALSSSYAVMDCNWKYQYDKYNDAYRWVPCNADVAGVCVRTDTDRDPWWSPAGLNRGQIKNAIKLAWNPDKADRDDLYVHGVNPVVSLPGQGIVLFGDKTLLSKPSAFDRINVRRLFIVLEKAIATASRYFLFEFNDEFTRAQFKSAVEPYLRRVQAARGITDFRVVCDETNNTGEVIDRNEFVGDIYIKPARSINFIQLNFIAVRTGVAFEEVIGKF